MDSSTIAAVATPAGCGGIGIVKISGTDALSIAGALFQKSGLSSNRPDFSHTTAFNSHHIYHGHIVEPKNGSVLDEVLMVVMLAPHSYTREDVVEIQAHAGPVVINAILDLVLKQGAVLAEPGEFTKRSYLNGRIDLTQAEAVIDIINAKTNKSLEIAASQIKGDMRLRIESIREKLLDILTETEAIIDFPEDIEEIYDQEKARDILQHGVIDRLQALIDRYTTAHVLRDGLKLVIVGRPNVGKSSLMNCLVEQDRAIVTGTPGTTRDVIEETFNIRGIPVTISDTAGLHEADDPVEALGIQKTLEYVHRSDLIIFMIDISCPLTAEDYQLYQKIADKRKILVQNKIDLVENGFELEIPDSWDKMPNVKTSALFHSGINDLKDVIAKITGGESLLDTGDTVVPSLRHKLALEKSLRASASALEGILKREIVELAAIDIKEASDSLGEIIGITVKEDIIEQIFSRFCIGK